MTWPHEDSLLGGLSTLGAATCVTEEGWILGA
jgi:hypothetical protein